MRKTIILILATIISFSGLSRNLGTEALNDHKKNVKSPQNKTAIQARTEGGPKQKMDSMVVTESYKELYLYNTSGQNTQTYSYEWDNGWTNPQRSDYTYDANSNITSEISYTYSAGQWVATDMTTSTYSTSLDQTVGSTWNGTAWVSWLKINYTYDGNGYLTNKTNATFANNQWRESGKTDYINDANGNAIQENVYMVSSSTWVKLWQTTTTYENNMITGYVRQQWDAGVSEWLNSSKAEYGYTSNGDNLEQMYYSWDLESSSWVNDYKYIYTYDGNIAENSLILPKELQGYRHKLLSKVVYLADGNVWHTLSSGTYYYSDLQTTALNDQTIADSYIAYPNPAADVVTFKADQTGKIKVTVYDAQGIQVLSTEGDGNEKVLLNGLSAGLYFYYVTGENGKTGNGKLQVR